MKRPADAEEGAAAGEARPRVVDDLSEGEARRVLSETVEVTAHLMSDEWKSFVSVGEAFAAHDTVRHSEREYARGFVHANSAESFNDRVRRTIAAVPSHQSRTRRSHFNEVGFRWSQRVRVGNALRRTRKGREIIKPVWSRIAPPFNCLLCSGQRSDANCVRLRKAEFRSGALWLCLVHKAEDQ